MKGLKKYYTLLCFILGYAGMCSSVFSAHDSQGHGKVSVMGEIVDTPCTLDTGSKDQTIDMGMIPISTLKQFGKSSPIFFNIKLINCRWQNYSDIDDNWKSFDITFNGPAKGNYFKTSGEAKGIALSIYDSLKNNVIPGKELPLQNIAPGDINLRYELHLVRDDQLLESGFYHAVINFKVSYY
ncbi:fimbrial protein [Proteus faecis]|uniref:fimbrial protein n=1 Tax=Proteus faecis TaxID=2050967 RepID=UPI00301C9203